MSDKERQELIDRLDRAEKILKTGFTERGKYLTLLETTYILSLIHQAREELGVVL